MQSYCEVKTGKSINWYDRLNELKELKKKGSIEYYQKRTLYSRDAMSWVTCACGNTCDIIPRDPYPGLAGPGRPKDKILSDLGGAFPTYISSQDYDGGIECLNRIEERSAYLIEQELKKQVHANIHAVCKGKIL